MKEFPENSIHKGMVSVIVPIYNVEKYLKKCIESIIAQKYANLEIILVDDGSTDSSYEICELYSKKDPRIILIHKENGGLADARNVGLKNAQGEYIAFVDSDDFIDADMIDSLIKLIQNHKSDIACCRYCDMGMEHDDENNDIISAGCVLDFTPMEAIKEMLHSERTHIFNNGVWNKVYKRSTLDGLQFPEGLYFEDVCYSINALYRAKKISVINKNLYYYNTLRDESITNMTDKLYTEKGKKGTKDRIKLFEQRLYFLKDNKLDQLYYNEYRRFLLILMKYYCLYVRKDETIVNYILEMVNRLYDEQWIKKYDRFFVLRIRFFLKFPKIYGIILNLKYKFNK